MQESIQKNSISKFVAFFLTELITYATAFCLVVGVYHAVDVRSMREITGVFTRYELIEVVVEQGTRWERSDTRIRAFVAYTVNGKQYEREWVATFAHTNMVGRQVKFYYDPTNPLRIRGAGEPFVWITPIIVGFFGLGSGFFGLIFFIGFKKLDERWANFESPWLPYTVKAFEMGGACIACWQWLSPVTNIPMLFTGVLIAGTGTVVNHDPMLLSRFIPEKTLFAQLISIKEEDGKHALLFQDKYGNFYSFLTPGIPDLEENSTYTLTIKGRKVQRFVSLFPRKLD